MELVSGFKYGFESLSAIYSVTEHFGISPLETNLVFVIGIVIAAIMTHFNRILKRKELYYGTEHGDAAWAHKGKVASGSEPMIARYKDKKNPFNNIIFARGVEMELNDMHKKYDKWKGGSRNAMVEGMPGTGKTEALIIPNLLQASANYVATDTKDMKALKETAQFHIEQGYNVLFLNLIDFASSMRFNPFVQIRELSDIDMFVDILAANTGGNDEGSNADPYWEDSAKFLWTASIAYMLFTMPKEMHTFETLMEILALEDAAEDGGDARSPLRELFDDLESGIVFDPDGGEDGKGAYVDTEEVYELTDQEREGRAFAIEVYNEFKKAPGKTMLSILSTSNTKLKSLRYPKVKELLSDDEIDFDLLAHEKTVIHVMIDDQIRTYDYIAALFFTLLFQRMTKIADAQPSKRLPMAPVLFLFDEFKNIGKIPTLTGVISTVRSRGMALLMCIQNYSQLKTLYTETGAEEIMGSVRVNVMMGTTSSEVSKRWAEKLNDTTAAHKSYSKSWAQTQTTSTGEQLNARKLITANAIEEMDPDDCLVLIGGCKPIRAKKYIPFVEPKHPNYHHIETAKKKQAEGGDKNDYFDVERYLSEFRAGRAKESQENVSDNSQVLLRGKNLYGGEYDDGTTVDKEEYLYLTRQLAEQAAKIERIIIEEQQGTISDVLPKKFYAEESN